MTNSDATDVVRRFWVDVWTHGRVEVLREIFDPEMTENGDRADTADFEQGVTAWRAIFPDFTVTVEELLPVGDDRVVSRVTYRGTHQGTIWGLPATGKQTEAIGIDIFRVRNGRITELWHAVDHLVLVRQIGATVTPKPTSG